MDELARALLLARTGVALEDSVATRGNLLAALLRVPRGSLGALPDVRDNAIYGIALSPRGDRIAVGDHVGEVRLFDLGKVYWYNPGPPSPRDRRSETAGTGRSESWELGLILAGQVGLTVTRSISDGVHEDLDVTNYSVGPVRFNLEVALRSDFAVVPPKPDTPKDKIVVLTVGRLHPRKGQLLTLQALQMLPPEIRSRIEYWVVGGQSKGTYEGTLRAAAGATAT